MLENEAIRQHHPELIKDLHMLNLELQMISLLSSCKINEKLKAWTVNHDSVVGVAHYQRKIINNQEVILKQLFFTFLKHCGRESQSMETIYKVPFFHLVTSCHSSSWHASMFLRLSHQNSSPRPSPQTSVLLFLLFRWFCITKAQKNWSGNIKPCMKY